LLDESTVVHIAAGEVVERPASVVKELVENAVDAGAQEVRVEVDDGGVARVEVTDDGEGIPREELELAVTRHATSKIRSAGDLESVLTLGFRGEALASIGAVSRLTISSRVPGSDVGHGIRMEGGRVVSRFEEGRPVGTTVRVERLFFNTPARRKFLRGAGVEAQESLRVVERAYLARPNVGFSVTLGGRPASRYPPTEVLRDAASSVLGEEFLDQAIPFAQDLGDGTEVEGVMAHPAMTRANSLSLYVSVNGRPVDAKSVSGAVRMAYQEYLPRTRFPVGVVHLRVPSRRLDVNVHPTKREVRLAHEREIVDPVRRAIREALQHAPEMAQPPPTAPEPSSSLPGSALSGPGPLSSLASAAGALRPSLIQRQLAVDSERERYDHRTLGPGLALVGPVFHLYWVASSAEGVVLIDQHAASERLLYDTLRRTGQLARQELVEPVRLDLTPRQRAALEQHHEAILAAGFTVEPFGKSEFRVRSVPVFRGASPRADAVRELLEELASGGRPTVPNGFVDRRAASIACHAAIRAGDSVAVDTMRRILDELGSNPDGAYACPHGRPIRILLPRGRIDQWFLRKGT
jgi:DNA mismatch repair protein MutL